MRETSIETLKRLERTIAKQEAELAELRSAVKDVRAMVIRYATATSARSGFYHDVRDRLASLPPVAAPNEGE